MPVGTRAFTPFALHSNEQANTQRDGQAAPSLQLRNWGDDVQYGQSVLGLLPNGQSVVFKLGALDLIVGHYGAHGVPKLGAMVHVTQVA